MLFVICFQVVALKKAIRELEQKVQDQEEELDDQAGQIQMLEQVDFQCFKFSLQIGKSVSRIFTLRHSQRIQGDYLVPCQVSAGKKLDSVRNTAHFGWKSWEVRFGGKMGEDAAHCGKQKVETRHISAGKLGVVRGQVKLHVVRSIFRN